MLIKLDGIQDVEEQLKCPAPFAYSIICRKADKFEKDGKTTGVKTMWEIEGVEDEYSPLFDFISLPVPGDDEDKIKFKMLLLKRVLYYTDNKEMIESGEFDTTQLIGSRSSIAIPVSIDLPTPANNMREGRNILWPDLPAAE